MRKNSHITGGIHVNKVACYHSVGYITKGAAVSTRCDMAIENPYQTDDIYIKRYDTNYVWLPCYKALPDEKEAIAV
ncbi:MAG: hypothetical protein HFH89_08370 [Lachnospiraceae bacterium]|nr:hypothetical protein [uncultured Acetatifactor sp.]MCI8287650.1 hypothetical protein [Lachnospiraceae bacterium]